MLEGEGDPGALKIDNPPAPVLMVGLQGSGKTTTTAKLARRLKDREGKRVLMASLDTNRPAAMEQLAILGTQIGVDTLPIVKGQSAVDIAKRAKQQATLGGYDVYLLDTAGRLHIDENPDGLKCWPSATLSCPRENTAGCRWPDRAGCRQRGR